MYSTENYIQYPMINHNEKEHKEESTHMYNSRNWHNIVKQLYFNTKISKK